MLKAEKIAAELITHCEQLINRQKNSIINELRLSERSLVKNIKQNPKRWNSDCLDIKINIAKPDQINAELSSYIKINHPDVTESFETTNDTEAAKERLRNEAEQIQLEEMLREQEKIQEMRRKEYREEIKRFEQDRRRQERIYRQLAQQPPDWPRGPARDHPPNCKHQ